jgi:serine/threonine protein kinase
MVTCVGTPRYCAPEISLRQHYDGFKADLYSIGAILYDILTKFSKNEPYNECVKECLKLSARLQINPDDRPSLDDVVKKLKEINSVYLVNFIHLVFCDDKINVTDAAKILASSPELRIEIINLFSSPSQISIENDGIKLESYDYGGFPLEKYFNVSDVSDAIIDAVKKKVLYLEKCFNDSDVSDAIIDDVKTSVTSLKINTNVNHFNDIIKKLLHKGKPKRKI